MIDEVLLGKEKHEVDSMNPFKSIDFETYDRTDSISTMK